MDEIKKVVPVLEIFKAMGVEKDVKKGDVDIEFSCGEMIVSLDSERFIKCHIGHQAFYATGIPEFEELEESLVTVGFTSIKVLPINTRVRIISSGIEGIIGGSDIDGCEDYDIMDLNYYVIPDGKTFDDEIMVLHTDVEEIK